MYFRDVVTLIGVTESTAANGSLVETPTSKTVMADKQSVKRTEFYQAQTAGFKPEVVFVIKACEYTDQPQLTHGTTTYDIIRTYEVENECLELVCQRGVR